MRIAIVQAGLSAGGTERVVSLLADDRCRRGDEVHVFAFAEANEESYFRFDPGVVIHRITEHGFAKFGLLRSLRRIQMLRAEFRRVKPDLVVSFLTKINILSLIATRGLGVPVVISERNNPQVQKKHWLWRLLSTVVQGRADALVMQTEAIAQLLPASLKGKAVVVGNPCDRRETAVKPQTGGFRIVAVGRLVAQKGFDTLIKAFAAIAPAFPQWSLVIYGEGPDRGSLEALVSSLALEGRIRMPGVTREAGSWADDATIFVLSSRYEGFPNVLVEAMAAGLPVVSTDCDFGPSEIIQPGISGMLVPVEEPLRLAAAMRDLMADAPLRQELGAAAQKAVARFSTEAVMAKWDACFRAVLHERAGAHEPSQGMDSRRRLARNRR